MKKSISIFLLAVFLPGLLLGWLALRSAEEQQIVYERRTAELYQKETESLAAATREAVEGERRAFTEAARRFLAGGEARTLAKEFPTGLTNQWGRKATGFVVAEDGTMLAPRPSQHAASNKQWEALAEQRAFLAGAEIAQVYAVQPALSGKSLAYGNQLRTRAQIAQKNKDAPSETSGMESERAAPADMEPGQYTQAKHPPEAPPELANLYYDDTLARGSIAASHAEPAPSTPKYDSKRRTAEAILPTASPPPSPSKEGKTAVKPLAVVDERVRERFKPASIEAEEAVRKAAGRSIDTPAALAQKGKDTGAISAKSDALARPQEDGTALAMQLSEKAKTDLITKTTSQSGLADAPGNPVTRNVAPQQNLAPVTVFWSAITPATADFQQLTREGNEGMIARFSQDELDLIFWLRLPEAPGLVFGCVVEASDLSIVWEEMLSSYTPLESAGAYVLALLDDKGRPVARTPAGTDTKDWKRPFVASEVGEALPHWEAALYLATPGAIADTARALRTTMAFTIAGAIALIALGGWLVVADVRRQIALAQQKTDFVSNVSHELKTPLTSIRMFAELLLDRPPPAERQGQFLRIITVEAERLTRLINNVLDFAKLDRRQRRFEKVRQDLKPVIEHLWESHALHLQHAGFQTEAHLTPGPYPVRVDADAVTQVLVNLLANAEKYSIERKDILLKTSLTPGWLEVCVLDRGMGVPKGAERKIFESFYRAQDALSSGIQGSGLGLTLARQIAREHEGELTFSHRDGGGSCFTLRLPLVGESDASPEKLYSPGK